MSRQINRSNSDHAEKPRQMESRTAFWAFKKRASNIQHCLAFHEDGTRGGMRYTRMLGENISIKMVHVTFEFALGKCRL